MFNEFLINATNLKHNAEIIKNKNPNSLLCIMVKANAYGVGLKQVVQNLSNQADYFGVANTTEASQTAKYTNKKILIVGSLEHSRKVSNRFSYACHSLQDIKFLLSLNKQINIHIKVNTGMNRYGVSTIREFKQMLNKIKNSNITLEGIFTHFATTDNYVTKQMQKFNKFVQIAKNEGFSPLIHVDNSAVNEKNNHHKAMVRVGFNMYNCTNAHFLPAVTLKSKIVQINNCKKGELVGYNYHYVATNNKRIAVIPIGYADGFSALYRGLNLNIHGKVCKVVNVCMDCFMLDITKTNLKKGDTIFILNKSNPLSKYSKHSGLSEYEVMCNFSHVRAKRKLVFTSNGKHKQHKP